MTIAPRRDLEAALYDWHNQHRLSRQNDDIPFWLCLTAPGQSIAVLGAGTGRVAVPLAANERHVIALDNQLGRLGRIPLSGKLARIAGDVGALPLADASVDAIVIPYSTYQLLPTGLAHRALLEAARVLTPAGVAYVDISTSFEARASTDWHPVLQAPFGPTGRLLEEWERARQRPGHLLLDRSFRCNGRSVLELTERWTHAGSLDIAMDATAAGLTVTRTWHGYGTTSTHRDIFACASKSACAQGVSLFTEGT